MRIGTLARTIAESPTLALNEKANLLKARGEALIHLGSGEPKSMAPIDAILAASAKLVSADVKYTPTAGILPLRKAVVAYTEAHYGRTVDPKNVMIAAGAKPALYAALAAVVDPGDEVVFPAPYWVSYPEMVRMVGGVPVVVAPPDGAFEPRRADLEAAINDRTKVIILNSPNNPSGAVYSRELVAWLVELCERRDIFLIMDDIYNRLVFDGCAAPSAYALTDRPTDESRVIVINGVSKAYAMTGFRIGWAVAARELIGVMTNIQAQSTSCPSALLQAAALGALEGDQSGVESLRLTLMTHRDVLVRELSAIPGVRVTVPQGTFYCLPDFRAYDNDSMRLSAFLLDKALVATVPGKDFGMEGHLRISYCGSVRDIIEGVRRIRWALDPQSPREIFIGDRLHTRDW
jgi:aspartate aminotransferase